MSLALDVAAILVLDVLLVVFTCFLIAVIWNNAVKEKFQVRGYLVWAYLLGIAVATDNAMTIAALSPMQGVPTALLFVLTLIMDVFLAAVTALLVILIWNNVIREELEVRSRLTWACLLGIVVAIANAVTIAYLLQ